MITETSNQQPINNAFDKATNSVSIGTSTDGKYYYAGTASKVILIKIHHFTPQTKIAESSQLHIIGLVHRRSTSCKCSHHHQLVFSFKTHKRFQGGNHPLISFSSPPPFFLIIHSLVFRLCFGSCHRCRPSPFLFQIPKGSRGTQLLLFAKDQRGPLHCRNSRHQNE